MHIHQAVNYVNVIDNYIIEHGCRLVMESDSDMDILAIYCYWKSNWKSWRKCELEVRSLDVCKLLDAWTWSV